MEVVRNQFRPELLNRIDEQIVFQQLDQDQITEIVRFQSQYLRDRVRDKDMDLEISEAALERVAEAGFDPVYGARPLKRVLQQRVENPLAKEILAGSFHPGDLIEVDVEGGELVFRRKEGTYAEAATA